MVASPEVAKQPQRRRRSGQALLRTVGAAASSGAKRIDVNAEEQRSDADLESDLRVLLGEEGEPVAQSERGGRELGLDLRTYRKRGVRKVNVFRQGPVSAATDIEVAELKFVTPARPP